MVKRNETKNERMREKKQLIQYQPVTSNNIHKIAYA